MDVRYSADSHSFNDEQHIVIAVKAMVLPEFLESELVKRKRALPHRP